MKLKETPFLQHPAEMTEDIFTPLGPVPQLLEGNKPGGRLSAPGL
jgi:hypothetical protein